MLGRYDQQFSEGNNNKRPQRETNYDKDLEFVIQSWIEETVGQKFPYSSFAESLKDGVILCRLLSVLKPGLCKTPRVSKMPFVQMENISNLLNGLRICGFHVRFRFRDQSVLA
eukprot:TRINITY_DN2311_c0_g1_i2.p1 TRINITY_DN2311_c0_g1~~TRINITY_DN2311_c0_g1_i2.p1  ORF type:complete len:113 (-),score=14.65 TRINITY_DN2311_c0_g1_i2:401-739(-)